MKNNMMMLGILAVGGLVVWQMTKKPAQAIAAVVPSGETKTTSTEATSIPLDAWQSLTQEQLKGLPVTQQAGTVGVETYYKTSQPIAIGDTGFKIWGVSESGATVIATKDPSTYEPWEWF